MQKESNEKIYSNAGNQSVLDLISSKKSSILDVGCGAGSLATHLKADGHCVDGITISHEEFQKAAPIVDRIYLHNLEYGLPEELRNDEYDYVICSHVLEHISYPARLLQDIHHVLKPNGYLIVALPNLMHYKSRWKLVKGNFDYQESGIWDYTHVRWYTFQTAYRLLVSHQFLIEQSTVTGELPFNRVFSRILPESARKGIYRVLTKLSKGLFGYQILLKAKKV